MSVFLFFKEQICNLMNESYFDEFCFKKPTIIMLLYFSSSSALLGVYPLAFLKILHLMLSVLPISLILHTSVDMAMVCSYLSRLKEDLWPEKRFLKVSPQKPMYFFVYQFGIFEEIVAS